MTLDPLLPQKNIFFVITAHFYQQNQTGKGLVKKLIDLLAFWFQPSIGSSHKTADSFRSDFGPTIEVFIL